MRLESNLDVGMR